MTEAPIEDDPAAFMDKARRACKSARVLLKADDADGACNRAYYATFDAARASILSVGEPEVGRSARTHRGVAVESAEAFLAEVERFLEPAEDADGPPESA